MKPKKLKTTSQKL